MGLLPFPCRQEVLSIPLSWCVLERNKNMHYGIIGSDTVSLKTADIVRRAKGVALLQFLHAKQLINLWNQGLKTLGGGIPGCGNDFP